MKRWAIFDPDRTRRYALGRTWDPRLPHVLYIMLNPSTANENEDDATLRRCIGFAQDQGFGSLTVVNLYSQIATNPKDLNPASELDVDNMNTINANASKAARIVCAWGANKHAEKRSGAIMAALWAHDLYCLGKTKHGAPKHPVRLAKSTRFELYRERLK